MSLSAQNLISLGVANYTIANNAELSVYAGAVSALLVMTTWNTNPVPATLAKKSLSHFATTAGIPLTDWQDKVSAVFRFADKVVRLMPSDPALLAVRDANDDAAALLAMREFFALKGLTCRHYFKQWSNDKDNAGKFDPEAAKRAKEAKELAAMEAALGMVSNIDASSVATVAATEAAIAAEAALTPLQRFAMSVAGISDHAELDAMFAVLNARADELRAIADSVTMPAASEPAVSRGQRAAKRKVAVAA